MPFYFLKRDFLNCVYLFELATVCHQQPPLSIITMKLGLTGGIGCGKSTVGIFLQQAGWLRIDSDQIVRELLDTDATVQQALLEYFGPEALLSAATPPQKTPPHPLQPPATAAQLPLKAAQPSRIVSAPNPPLQTAEAAAQTSASTASAPPPAPAAIPPAAMVANRALIARRIFAHPHERTWLEALLHPRVRTRWETLVTTAGASPVVVEIPLLFEKSLEKHFDLTVCVEADHHVQLARLQSRGMSLADAEARIASQMPLAEKIARADRVLSNNGTEDFLRTQVLRLHNEWLA